MGHPLNALTWLVNDRSERGVTLMAGQIITTGTCTGLIFAKAGDVAVADFGILGEVRVTFTE
jgi:2-keto-4-pentenoate hydratase